MFSMCSEFTPCARIPDTRIPQFMQPCYQQYIDYTRRSRQDGPLHPLQGILRPNHQIVSQTMFQIQIRHVLPLPILPPRLPAHPPDRDGHRHRAEVQRGAAIQTVFKVLDFFGLFFLR